MLNGSRLPQAPIVSLILTVLEMPDALEIFTLTEYSLTSKILLHLDQYHACLS